MYESGKCSRMRKRSARNGLILLLLAVSGGFFFLCSLFGGSIAVPLEEAAAVLSGKSSNETYRSIIMEIRFPRALSASILGGALALSGYLLQTLFHNPIAGPFVLGISSGSKMAVALVMVFLLGRAVRISSVFLIGAAFMGALFSMGFVLLMSRRVKSISLLVISGVMLGYICSAVTDFVITFASDADIVNLHHWSRGSFSGMSWKDATVMALVIFPAVMASLFLAKPISAYQLGEAYAGNLGVSIRCLRLWLILLSSMLSACVAAYAGPVSFVGIAVPQMVKRFLGKNQPLVMIPACFLGGSMFCLGCDLIARSVFAPTELSISTVTAIFGAPVVLWVMLHRRDERIK